MSDPSLRRATAADATAIAQLVEGAYEKYVERIGRRPAPMDADYGALIASANVWILTCDDNLVGSLVTYREDDHLLLDSVAVAPGTQGRGYGALLLRRAEDDAHDAGLTEVRLYTNAAMTENLTFYPRHGYVETHRANQDGFDRVFFSKRLAGPLR
ncbi:GNAT family N-acetyltransferase [Mycobacterium sp. RTGN5]|uniref:GNAT family N-acetyltransferase n=1 Tax=Mycobacterium sp. RTGN5 TaxID=3016522 RepID=UPI0029C693B6|nr:GNAT family N-acetyltransferase [Mycobacterium sp. RTGN5]